MKRTIWTGFIALVVLILGAVLLQRPSTEKPPLPSGVATPLPPSLPATNSQSAPTDVPLASDRQAGDGAPADRIAALARELTARLSALSIRPEMRELVARRMAQDYHDLFQSLRLSAEKEELLGQIIVDRFFTVIGPDRDSYDKLAQDLLTPGEYEKYAAYRDELPVKAMIKEVSAALQFDGAGAASEEVGRAIRSSPNRASRYWADVEKKYLAGEINDAELSQVEQNAVSQFDQSVAREVHSLSSSQRAALRAWFQDSVRATVTSVKKGKK